ncbi:MAG: LysR substrate-binding domain-containing protein, partial [Hydrogenophaga sp.]|uniref:LysR substrate-binding domain-containing protein n=1 Tax=Hydrogenophaga sp. TaxID=1904254 RepID=UPI002A359122
NFIAVGSPQWIADHHVRTARDQADKRLLVEAARPEIWNKWFVVNGMPQHVHTSYMRFDYFDMVIAAALNHLGIALVPRLLVESDIAAGRLQPLDSQPLSVGTSYVLSYPPHKAQFPPLFVFRNWLLSGLPEPA